MIARVATITQKEDIDIEKMASSSSPLMDILFGNETQSKFITRVTRQYFLQMEEPRADSPVSEVIILPQAALPDDVKIGDRFDITIEKM